MRAAGLVRIGLLALIWGSGFLLIKICLRSFSPVIALLVLGGVGTGVAYVLNYRIITDDGPILASTVTYLIPVVAVVLGLLMLDERVTTQLVLGVVGVLVGVALTRRRPVPPGSRTHPVLDESPPAAGETPRRG